MSHLFKIGVTCAMGAPANSPFPIQTDDFCQSADWLAQNGFDTMEVHIRDPRMVDGGKLIEHCIRTGIEISSIGTGMAYGMEGLSITSEDKDIRKAAIKRLEEQMDLGVTLHAPIVIGSMRGVINEGQTFSQVDALMVDSMKELADYAEKVQCDMVVEAIDRFESNYLKRAEDVLGLIDRVGSSRVYVHLDSYHMNLEEQNMREAILICKDRLGHFHVADNTRYYPGWGHIDFRTILSALKEIGYKGSLTIECYPYPDGETAVLNGLKHLTALMDAYHGD